MHHASGRPFAVFLLLALFGIHAGTCVAGRLPYRPTQAEMPSLPAFCKAAYGLGNPADRQYWAEHFGPANWPTMYLFCDGLNHLNRADRLKRDPAMRNHYLGVAEQNFDRQLAHTTEDYRLRAELHLLKGKALSMRGSDAALEQFTKAAAMKPELAEAYVEQADFLVGKKQKARALEIVTEGLRHVPGVKALQRRYDELGGKKPYPEPLPKTPPVAKAAAGGQAETAPPTPAAAHGPGAADSPPDGQAPKPACRFCPELNPRENPPASTPAASPKAIP